MTEVCYVLVGFFMYKYMCAKAPTVSNYMHENKWVEFQFLAEFSLCNRILAIVTCPRLRPFLPKFPPVSDALHWIHYCDLYIFNLILAGNGETFVINRFSMILSRW